jgi:alpha-N-arabinofuranosidase
MDEWNYWYGRYVYGELGVQYHLKDALGIARGLHAFFRNSDLYFMANYAQTVNVIGAIKTSRTAAVFDTTGLVLKLYRNRFGSIPVAVSGAAGKLDIAAALTEDGTILTVAVVNPQANLDAISFDVRAAVLSGRGSR